MFYICFSASVCSAYEGIIQQSREDLQNALSITYPNRELNV